MLFLSFDFFGFELQEFGEDLVNILDTLRVKYVIGIGHGAGANIMMRFGMVHSQRCLGIVLLHPTAMNATLFDNIAVRKKFQWIFKKYCK